MIDSQEDRLLRLQKDGNIDYFSSLMDWDEHEYNTIEMFTIENDKIYIIGREVQSSEDKVKYVIKIVDLEGQELYYGDIATDTGDGSKSTSLWMLSVELR